LFEIKSIEKLVIWMKS